MPPVFVHEQPSVRIVFGDDALGRLAGELERLSLRRVVIVATGSLRALAHRCATELGPLYAGIVGGVRRLTAVSGKNATQATYAASNTREVGPREGGGYAAVAASSGARVHRWRRRGWG
jgi:hypothetical protein